MNSSVQSISNSDDEFGGRDPDDLRPPFEPTPQDAKDIATFAARPKPVVLLRPRAARGPLPPGTSKMGGSPDLPPTMPWPRCRYCDVPLRFVLQLFRREFPELPFPPARDQFVLFRCPKHDCGAGPRVGQPEPDNPTGRTDQYLWWTYASAADLAPRPEPQEPGTEPRERVYDPPVPECRFDAQRTVEYPLPDDGEEWWGERYNRFYARHFQQAYPIFSGVIVRFFNRYRPHEGTKIGGFAAWQQGRQWHTCDRCGGPMDYVFQLASNDRNPAKGTQTDTARPYVSEHGIMIGDFGNIYFFLCPPLRPRLHEDRLGLRLARILHQ